ncbi:hypothetical protein [Demequina litorisediminis]|uniref:Uncharacterized protein n=1 Tax=Demequina litorisediminis TaxID=1849022 RepID=A0ABQ6IDL6_9MICO|nr:hypothetical protein [Demequina litorisediminis]GMA35511.1 hypothetical protein GCM10025876_17150 [Demequina litorisediminis]
MTYARRSAALAVAVAAATLLTSCVRATVDTTIGEDDTFSQHTVAAYSDSVASQITDYLGADVDSLISGIESNDEFVAFQAAHPGQVEIADYDDGEPRGRRTDPHRHPSRRVRCGVHPGPGQHRRERKPHP